jgi:hypothetical protein
MTAVELSTVGPAVPWQWLVQVRSDTGWTSSLLPGTTTVFPLSDRRDATRVTVRTLNRVGELSSPVSLSLTDTIPGGAASPAPGRSSGRGSNDVP